MTSTARLTPASDGFRRVLVFVAHPDDESIACSGLLQRATASLVVFAVDGAPRHYGFEQTFGSLERYSDIRFLEASRALRFIRDCSVRRLTQSDARYFGDQHLFLDLPGALRSLTQIVGKFSPDVLVSHACEGGHIDHDACHFLALEVARSQACEIFEFPLYRKTANGGDIFQEFRHLREGEFVLELTETELGVKQRMLAEYRTQQNVLSVFRPQKERFRPAIREDYARHDWHDYAFENRRTRLPAESFLRKVREFEENARKGTKRASEKHDIFLNR